HVSGRSGFSIEDFADDPGVVRGRASGEVLKSSFVKSEVGGGPDMLLEGVARDLPDRGVASDGYFINTVLSVDHERSRGAELGERMGHERGGLCRGRSKDLEAGAGWVRQRSDEVEHGAELQIAPHRLSVLHRGMECGGE